VFGAMLRTGPIKIVHNTNAIIQRNSIILDSFKKHAEKEIAKLVPNIEPD
jgi:hypothetical protein